MIETKLNAESLPLAGDCVWGGTNLVTRPLATL